MTCDRCKADAHWLRASFFNTQMCCESCLTKERKHPKYPEAKAIELEEVKKGNYNFKGIGLPIELQ